MSLRQPRRGESPPPLRVKNLAALFPLRAGLLRRLLRTVRAVDGVSLRITPGETLGLVGEAGCGKTTTGRTIVRLVPIAGGTITFDGARIDGLGRGALRSIRGRMPYMFQGWSSTLNPMLAMGGAVSEPLRIHSIDDEMGGQRWIARLFDSVGLSLSVSERLPREFSGGQKQRIGIARALALRPSLMILDEPVDPLDVSIRAQIVNLLEDL